MLLRGKRLWVAAKIDDAGGPAQQAKIQKNVLPLVKIKMENFNTQNFSIWDNVAKS